MQPSKKVIQNIKTFLYGSIKPVANRMDVDSELIRHNFNQFNLGCFKLKALKSFGGFEVGEDQFHEFKEEVCRYSCALALLQQQHQAAIRILDILLMSH